MVLTAATVLVLYIGMHLKDYLALPDTSSADLATTLGVTREALRRYASGERTPRPEMLRQIVAVTGGRVTLEDLIASSGDAASRSASIETVAATESAAP